MSTKVPDPGTSAVRFGSPPTGIFGAYGFRLTGIGRQLLLPVPSKWPSIHLTQQRVDSGPSASLKIGPEQAIVPLLGGGTAIVDRDPPQAVFKVSHQLSEDELAHPYLGPIAALHAHWLGRQVLHGGALAIGQRAWGILGPRQAGKSSLLAEAVRRGITVMADDLLVVEGKRLFAGPRSLDLRQTAALHFKAGRELGIVGRRGRWRLELDPAPLHLPLAGWIFLEWGPLAGIERLPMVESLRRLLMTRTVKVEASDPAPWLDLAALPTFRYTGPRDWTALAPVFDALLETIAGLETQG